MHRGSVVPWSFLQARPPHAHCFSRCFGRYKFRTKILIFVLILNVVLRGRSIYHTLLVAYWELSDGRRNPHANIRRQETNGDGYIPQRGANTHGLRGYENRSNVNIGMRKKEKGETKIAWLLLDLYFASCRLKKSRKKIFPKLREIAFHFFSLPLLWGLIIVFFFLWAGTACHPYEPFKCPGDGACISIQYLCDGAADCQDGYDEDSRLCTAGES